MPLSISNIKKAKILSNFFRPRLRNYLGSGELLPFKDGNGAGLDPKPAGFGPGGVGGRGESTFHPAGVGFGALKRGGYVFSPAGPKN